MNVQALTGALSYLASLEFLDNYRSIIAGVGSILFGLALIALAFAGDPRGDMKEGITAILAGLALIGHAGKQQKLIEATKAQTDVVEAAAADASLSAARARTALAAPKPKKGG